MGERVCFKQLSCLGFKEINDFCNYRYILGMSFGHGVDNNKYLHSLAVRNCCASKRLTPINYFKPEDEELKVHVKKQKHLT